MDPASPVKPGDLLAGKYRVERVLGVGGMGVVVAATHLELGQPVALKFMLAETAQRSDMVERFTREARAAGQLRSQHVARIQDVGRLENGAPYIVMELLDGMDLAQVLAQQGVLAPATAVDFILQACEALAEAHVRGIIHRDLKPGNLFVTVAPNGSPLVKVLDFGISKLSLSEGPSVTQTTAVFGSPAYMSPEQLRSTKGVDARSDIWSLGIILYECLCGHVPFNGETMTELGLKIVMDPLPPLPPLAAARPGLEAVVYRCLEKDPARRPASIAELAALLGPYASPGARGLADGIQGIGAAPTGGGAARVAALTAPPPTQGRKIWPFVVGGLVLAGAGVGAAVVLAGGKPVAATVVDAGRPGAVPTPDASPTKVVVTAPPDAAPTVVVAAPPDAAPVVVAAEPDATPAVVEAAAPDAAAPEEALPSAPWADDPIAADDVPAVYLAQWKKAENRETCPLLVPTDLGVAEGARARAANFSGGWAVAYDKKGARSMTGVAGAGIEKGGAEPFPHTIAFADGSRLNYGLEGNTGPGWLAYLSIPQGECLYNVWSAVGEEHLLQVISGLRRVE